jgi:cation diffusion facilitator family transporter
MDLDASKKQKVAGLSMAVSAAMALGKFAVALLTGSLGVLSEALHSLIDFGATVMTWFAIRWADVPADDDHHFGHAKIESVAALLEAVLLALTAVYVAYEALQRLIVGHTPPQIEWWAPALVALAIVVDYNRSRALGKVAKDASSAALAADAAHFTSDMYGSGAVLLGLLGVWAGWWWADSVAALAVSGFVGWIGFDLGRETLSTLLDRAPEGLTSEIRALVENQDGVLHVEQLRLRQAGPTAYLSLVADVPRALPETQVDALRAQLARKIGERVPNVDLGLVLNPIALDTESVFEKVQMIAVAHRLYVHHLVVQKLGEKLAISFDVEMEGATPLDLAHEQATELEEAIRLGLGTDVEVESHIEPQPVHLLEGAVASRAVHNRVEKALRVLAKTEKPLRDIHSVRVRQMDGGLYIHYHCRFRPKMRIDTVHDAVDRIEILLMRKLKGVRRIVAHAEPLGHSKHRL